MSILRPFWSNRIQQSWSQRSIVWLAGVRRTGKTTLAETFDDSTYINCDLPSSQRLLEDPENFYKNLKTRIVIFDEIHQLPEASVLLKIGADHFKSKKILATGSSTLIASKKFKDSLTDRKRNLHFLPVLISELEAFKCDLKKRILFGGLPPSLLSDKLDNEFFGEWLDSFYARDVQEIFAVEKRQPFLKALEFLLMSNGTQLEVTKLAQAAGISRPTATKYLDILENTKALTVVRPFSKKSISEMTHQPKIYGFDTGFYCYVRGIKELRSEDCGVLLENLTLETLQASGYGADLCYWRTKSQQEIDFVIQLDRDKIIAIECKWKEKNFSANHVESFRRLYPDGPNWVVTSDSTTRTVETKNLKLEFISIFDLEKKLVALKKSK